MDGQIAVSDKTASERKAFKDYFDRAAAKALADQMHRVMPKFDRPAFVRRATKNLTDLEFNGRVQQFSDALAEGLPDAKPKALDILRRSLPAPLPNCDSVTDGWLQWPLGQFIADHGVPHFEPAMKAMVALTQCFSSEFAVRPFVEQRPEETFARLQALTDHPSPHVRRWCSEGVRPRLPWGKRLTALVADPAPIWPILEALKDDQERYVSRSVANNLNDVAKDHPAMVVARCKAWSKDAGPDRTWLIKHALRSLLKDGDPGALAVVGFGPPKKLSARLEVRPKRIKIGGAVTLVAELTSSASRPQSLMVDYVVHFVRSRGQASPKVFKWTQTELKGRGATTLEKKHALKRTTIRSLFSGRHRVEIQVNGVSLAEASFDLTV